jgi:acyl-CoA synthetase (NDP forming)
VSNPLDLTAQGLVDPDLYYRTLAAVFDDDRFGSVLAGIIQTDPVTVGITLAPILRAVRELAPGKPVIFAGLDAGAPIGPRFVGELRAMQRLNALARRDFQASDAAPLPAPGLPDGEAIIPEYRAKQILAPLGIAFPQGVVCTSVEAAVKAATALGFPVVIKAQSASLSHMSDAGGVILNLADADAVRAGWDRFHANVAAYDPAMVLDGVLVEAMGARGTELIIGAKNDPEWGPVILVGFGGVTAEILQDVRLLPPDLPHAAIVRELGLLKSAAILHGFRGSPALDVDAVAQMVATLGRIMLAEPGIREIDLNPVMVYPCGQGVVALDALMVTAEQQP